MMMNRVEVIENYLDELLPNPPCELQYEKDYELLIAVMLSAQTTDKRVNQVTSVLFSSYPTLEELKEVPITILEEILRPLGSFRKKAQYVKSIATILVDQYKKEMPTTRKELEQFPGIGRKTVSVVLSELYDLPEFAVDTHVERVSKRLLLAKEGDDVLEIERKLKRKFEKCEWGRRHKQMVLFGRYYCKAMRPECESCKLKGLCRKKIK